MKLKSLLSKFLILVLAIFFLIPDGKLAAQSYQYDLGFNNNDDIWINEDYLIIGDTVRLYATVRNFGTDDSSGYVTFYNGTTLIDESQVVTVLPNSTDDVWVDFEIPETEFNILARIMGVMPDDDNQSNNEAVTPVYTPEEDWDGDGIPDSQDPDIDNDNLNNDDELDLGTDLFNEDTDVDGIIDGLDEYPLDPDNNPEEPRDIFEPLVSSNDNTNQPALTNNQLEEIINKLAKNKPNENINYNLDNLNLPQNQSFENRYSKKFFNFSNTWFLIILFLVIIIILCSLIFIINHGKDRKDRVLKIKTLPQNIDIKKINKQEVVKEPDDEIKQKKLTYKKIKVKKGRSKPKTAKKIKINK